MFLRLSVPAEHGDLPAAMAAIEGYLATLPEPTYGGQLQTFGVPGLAAEGRMAIDYTEVPVTLGDGETVVAAPPDATRPPISPTGRPSADMQISPRVAPQMIGLGLLEAVPEADILALADPDDADGDGISGRPNTVWSEAERPADARPLRPEGRAADDPRPGGLGLRRRHRHLDHAASRRLGRLHRAREAACRGAAGRRRAGGRTTPCSTS